MKRKLFVVGAMSIGAMIVPVGGAAAHVHGVTPLNCGVPANGNAGAAVPFGNVPADVLNGPSLLIPVNAGGAVAAGGGGKHSVLCDE